MASKRPAEETPNPAGNTVTIAELFEQLGAPLFRSDSIGAMHPDGTVYLICLPGDVNDGKALIYQQPEDERTESMASSERWMHLQRVRAGHPAVLVTPSGELFATVGLEEEAGSFYVGIGEKIQAKTVET